MSMQKIQVEVGRNMRDRPMDDQLSATSKVLAGLAEIPGEKLVDSIRETVDLIGKAFTPHEGGPESCEIKFGLKITAGGTVVLAQVGTELNLEVSVTWKRGLDGKHEVA